MPSQSTGKELLAKRKDGSEIYVEISLSLFLLEKEKLILGAIRDITDRKKLTNQLKESLTLLETRNKEMG